MAIATASHINLDALAARIISAGDEVRIMLRNPSASNLSNGRTWTTTEEYKGLVVEFLRRERLRLVDAEFRRQYVKYF